jgi:hypothetical protein
MKSITRLSLALMMFSLFSISYLVTSVSAQGMTPPGIPQADDSSRPIGEGGEAGGPAATDMSDKMINDGGFGANSFKKSVADCVKSVRQTFADRTLIDNYMGYSSEKYVKRCEAGEAKCAIDHYILGCAKNPS